MTPGPPAPDDATQVYTIDLGDGRVADIEAPKGTTAEQLQSHPDVMALMKPQGSTIDAGPQGVGDVGYALPDQPMSKMSAQDEATIEALKRTGTASQIRQFAASKGFGFDIDLDAWVKDRDARVAAGQPIDANTYYDFPDTKRLDPEKVGGAGGAATRGALDTLSVGAIPKIAAAGRAVSDMFGNGGSFSDNYAREHDIGQGVRQQDQDEHPWFKLAGELFGGVALPAGLEGVGLKAGSDVLRAGGSMAEARAAAAVAVRNRAAAVSTAYGAGHGALSADDPASAATGALTEGALGAATGIGIGALGAKLATRAPQVATEGQQVAAAAERQGIDVLPADVGGPLTRRVTSATAQTPFGAGPVISAAQRVTDQAQGARDRIAAVVGQALDPEAQGEMARSGALSYIGSSRTAAGNVYNAAEQASQGVRIPPTQALTNLDQHIAELGETPGGAPALERLMGLRDELAQGDVTVPGLRRMRTVLRDEFFKDGLRGSDTERRVNQVMDAAAADITDGLRAQGRGNVASLFQRADRMWRERAETIDNVLKPIIGTRDKPRSGEQIVKTLMADMQGNNARAVRFLATLPPDERNNTVASVIGSLGRQNAGAQNAAGDGFSLPLFLTHWNKIGETAKRAYFGAESRAALNDLARVSQGSKEAQAYANRSNTGGALEAGRLLTYITALPTLGGSVIGQYGVGRLLASPRFARWLARVPRTSTAPPAYIERLSRIARAEPQIANEVLQLQQRLTGAFSAPARLAADEGGDHPGRIAEIPQQNEQQQVTQ